MEYNFQDIEQHWKKLWQEKEIYKVSNHSDKPKYYILDMFPYPSGAGLHVGHPLGYIASDIYARYKRLCGYNVLHPMGYDAFGLPAEQYALETGQHPVVTTEQNIQRYRQQLDNIGFCYDWSREVRTSDPSYYKWTQWIFLQLFHSWYDRSQQKARPIQDLIAIFEKEGNANTPCPEEDQPVFDPATWKNFSGAEQRAVLMKYRLAYLSHADVWWCEGLGTVLANDEVVNGVSERGGFPVVKKKMRQWFLRITEYADRLLAALDTLEWSDAMKEMQRNWIGKSNGAQLRFALNGDQAGKYFIEVFTTRPDTIFGVDFMVLAPEHELVSAITTPEQKDAVAQYQAYVQSRSERERMSEVKQVTGCFTGAYAVHPFTGKSIPVWISEYVLAGYGTGAIMAVPAGDERDHAFAKHFNIPITNIFGDLYNGTEAYAEKQGKLGNSDFLNGLEIREATEKAIDAIEKAGIGKRKVNYKLRDAGFSRQRYWGEPFPIIYKDDIPYGIDEPELNIPDELRQLPVTLPDVENYGPGPEGQGPLANIREWVETPGGQRETNTMPGYAGSSWYFLRYMDPHNEKEFASRDAIDYWQQVDLYIGGKEHAVGHLLYSRMWTKVLYDLGYLSFDEPFKRLINQGMIQGVSQYAYVLKGDYEEGQMKAESNTVRLPNGTIGSTPKAKLQLYSSHCIDNTNRHKFKPFNIPIDLVEINTNDSSRNKVDIRSAVLRYPQRLDVIYILYDTFYYCDEGRWFKWDGERNNLSPVAEGSSLEFYSESGVEKMSKSKYNVINPDDIVQQYGADTFRMYEMFLGPIDVSKPWDTQGIEGVHRFLRKLWRLYFDAQRGWLVTDDAASEAELRVVHKTIKKIGEDIERFSFNTAVSQFMICVNELTALNCHKRAVLEPLAILIAPFAPHLAEELWQKLHPSSSEEKFQSVLDAQFPAYEERYVTDNTKKYPVAVNGKTRTEMEFPLDATPEQVEQALLADATVQKWLEGKPPKKVIYVKGKMINVVV
jgi:leucyl-tRNA synthetase